MTWKVAPAEAGLKGIPPMAGLNRRGDMYWTYVIKSEQSHKYYVGSTGNLEERLKNHNAGLSKYTSSGIPWECIYRESFSTRAQAMKREKQIKAYKGGEAFKKLIE